MMRKHRLLKWAICIIVTLLTGFCCFLLWETRDEVQANFDNIDAKIEAFHNTEKMAGFAVAVFTGDSILYTKGFGYADLENKQRYTTKTSQYQASISKTVIGVALAKAESMGLLKLDDPINQYLPFEVVHPGYPASVITVRHLATHTSSLDYNEEVVESLYVADSLKTASLEHFMHAYFAAGDYGEVKFSSFLPGSNWNYSNIGAGLAAYIIELVSGMPFNQFTRQYVFVPLQLEEVNWNTDSRKGDQAAYYELTADSLHQIPARGVSLYPCRDLVANLEEMIQYAQALLNKDESLLVASAYEELFSYAINEEVSDLSVDDHGLFFITDRNQFGITYQLTGGSGADNAIQTMLFFDPISKLGYVFMGNTGMTPKNRYNHMLIFRTLVSLGDHYWWEGKVGSNATAYRLLIHNWYSRIRAFF